MVLAPFVTSGIHCEASKREDIRKAIFIENTKKKRNMTLSLDDEFLTAAKCALKVFVALHPTPNKLTLLSPHTTNCRLCSWWQIALEN